jgi:hypothetical protein
MPYVESVYSRDASGQYNFFHLEPPRYSLERFIAEHPDIKKRLDPGDEHFLYLNPEGGYPSSEEVHLVDRHTHLSAFRIFFDNWNTPNSETADFKARILEMLTYRNLSYHHPLTGENIPATEVTIRAWDIDNLARKRHREGLTQLIVIYEDQFLEEIKSPRSAVRIISESIYDLSGPRVSTTIPQTYAEKLRSYFLPTGMVIYIRDDQAAALVYSRQSLHSAGQPSDWPPHLPSLPDLAV